MDASLPAQIGRYQIRSLIGRGGMGEVYGAFDPSLDRLVALKTIVAGSDNPMLVERLQREARACGRLHHPGIVTIHDLGESAGTVFIAMEWLQGQSLADAMNAGTLAFGDKLRILTEILEALAYAHGEGIIHRDIKPSNVWILPNGRAKLLDFGLARLAHVDALTLPGEVMGTPYYMSPEQLKGQTVDGRSDVFSTGVMGYELLARRRAFDGDSITAIIIKVLGETPPPIGTAWSAAFPDVDAIIAKAIAKVPDDRYTSAAEMAATLGAFVGTHREAIARVDRDVAEQSSRAVRVATSLLADGQSDQATQILTKALAENPDATAIRELLQAPTELIRPAASPVSSGGHLASPKATDTRTAVVNPPFRVVATPVPPPAPAARDDAPRHDAGSHEAGPRPAASIQLPASDDVVSADATTRAIGARPHSRSAPTSAGSASASASHDAPVPVYLAGPAVVTAKATPAGPKSRSGLVAAIAAAVAAFVAAGAYFSLRTPPPSSTSVETSAASTSAASTATAASPTAATAAGAGSSGTSAVAPVAAPPSTVSTPTAAQTAAAPASSGDGRLSTPPGTSGSGGGRGDGGGGTGGDASGRVPSVPSAVSAAQGGSSTPPTSGDSGAAGAGPGLRGRRGGGGPAGLGPLAGFNVADTSSALLRNALINRLGESGATRSQRPADARWLITATADISLRPSPMAGTSAMTADYTGEATILDRLSHRAETRHFDGHALDFGAAVVRAKAVRELTDKMLDYLVGAMK